MHLWGALDTSVDGPHAHLAFRLQANHEPLRGTHTLGLLLTCELSFFPRKLKFANQIREHDFDNNIKPREPRTETWMYQFSHSQ